MAVGVISLQKRTLGWDVQSGVARRLVSIFLHSSAALADTYDLSTGISGLTSVVSITGYMQTPFASIPTVSGTTVTFNSVGHFGNTFLGYY